MYELPLTLHTNGWATSPTLQKLELISISHESLYSSLPLTGSVLIYSKTSNVFCKSSLFSLLSSSFWLSTIISSSLFSAIGGILSECFAKVTVEGLCEFLAVFVFLDACDFDLIVTGADSRLDNTIFSSLASFSLGADKGLVVRQTTLE